MKIEVTETDIENGLREDASHCPIALALQRATQKPFRVGCTKYWIYEVEGTILQTPLVHQFVKDFDKGFPVQPFSFELDELLYISNSSSTS